MLNPIHIGIESQYVKILVEVIANCGFKVTVTERLNYFSVQHSWIARTCPRPQCSQFPDVRFSKEEGLPYVV